MASSSFTQFPLRSPQEIVDYVENNARVISRYPETKFQAFIHFYKPSIQEAFKLDEKRTHRAVKHLKTTKDTMRPTLHSLPNLRDLPRAFETKEDLSALLRFFSMSDLFCWDYSRMGCNLRADLIAHYLLHLEIPEENLAYQFAYLKDQAWAYHTAIRITLKDESIWVLDPLFSSRALSLEEWLQAQQPKASLTENQSLNGIEDVTFSLNEKSVLFSVPISRQLHNTHVYGMTVRLCFTERETPQKTLSAIAQLKIQCEDELFNTWKVASSTLAGGSLTRQSECQEPPHPS